MQKSNNIMIQFIYKAELNPQLYFSTVKLSVSWKIRALIVNGIYIPKRN